MAALSTVAVLGFSAVFTAWFATLLPALLEADSFDTAWAVLRWPAWVLALAAFLAVRHAQTTRSDNAVAADEVTAADTAADTYAELRAGKPTKQTAKEKLVRDGEAGGCCQTDSKKQEGGCCQTDSKKQGEAGGCCQTDSKKQGEAGGCCQTDSKKQGEAGGCCQTDSNNNGAKKQAPTGKSAGKSSLRVYFGTTTGTAKVLLFSTCTCLCPLNFFLRRCLSGVCADARVVRAPPGPCGGSV
jgi:hypothetical protein